MEKVLLDLGASVNLLPYSMYKQLGLGELKPTSITLSLVDRSIKIPKGNVEDVVIQVDKFYYPVYFVVLHTEPAAAGQIMYLSSSGDHSWPLPMRLSTVEMVLCNSPSEIL